MSLYKRIPLFFFIVMILSCTHENPVANREKIDFNFDWKFHYGDETNAHNIDFNDSAWRNIRLPHDWSVEHSFTQENTAGATAFLPGGIGWYRKTFEVSEHDKNKNIWIEFDGVYTNSEVWINGHYLGKRPYGYIPFKYDLTEYLDFGEKNVIAVKADRSDYIDCRWYPGSGIYRNVKMVKTHKVNIPQWGISVATPQVDKEQAEIAVDIKLRNLTETKASLKVVSKVFYKNEEKLSMHKETRIDAAAETSIQLKGMVKKPILWDVDAPEMYSLHTEVFIGNEKVDNQVTPFGIRSFSFHKDNGFFLNGRNLLLKGVCLHHDGGLVGSAVPRGVWERRLKTLKESGCNAIRTAHNPPSEEFLDLCDSMGFLVQDEAFDEWNNPKDKRHNYNQQKADSLTMGYTHFFSDWAERDIKNMVLRDRNHPCIIMWSIGNEIEWTYPRYGASTGYWGSNKVGDVNYYWDEPPLSIETIKENFNKKDAGKYNLAETAKNLVNWIKEIDTSRPVTANLVIPSVSNFSGYAEALDIVGLSYRQSVYDYCKRNYPDMTFLGTENWVRYHEWKPVLEKKFISGVFLWTGINYMGESRKWPVRGSGSGMLDFAGFKKPSYHLFKTLWNEEPHVYITTQVLDKSPYKYQSETNSLAEKQEGWAAHQKWGWQDVNAHWNYKNGDSIAVEVYSNQTEVELFLNGKSVGIRKLSEQADHIMKYMVPFAVGTLTAKSVSENSTEYSITTAGKLGSIVLKVDKTNLQADGYDVLHAVLQLCDEQGNPIRHEDKEIVFEIDGNIRLLGVDNGSPSNVQDYQTNKIVTDQGRALLVLQAKKQKTTAKIQAVCGEIKSKNIIIQVK